MADQKFLPVQNRDIISRDARFGELGMIHNPSGEISTEFSITENIPELGGWVGEYTIIS